MKRALKTGEWVRLTHDRKRWGRVIRGPLVEDQMLPDSLVFFQPEGDSNQFCACRREVRVVRKP